MIGNNNDCDNEVEYKRKINNNINEIDKIQQEQG